MENEPWYQNMRPTLYMTLPLQDAEKAAAPDDQKGYGALATASKRLREGNRAEAEAILDAAWRRDDEDPRLRLWAANVLRDMGTLVPGTPGSRVVLGVVLEVPVGHGFDTAAAYPDGSFRYYNAVRGAIIVNPGVAPVINNGAAELASIAAAFEPSPVRGDRIKISVLTPAGFIEGNDSHAVGELISAKALEVVRSCIELRDRFSKNASPGQSSSFLSDGSN